MRGGWGGHGRLVILGIVATLLGGCANDPAEPAVVASPEALAPPVAPTPAPPPGPDQPVIGSRAYSQWSNSSDGILLRRGAAPADDAAVNGLMHEVGDWLDEHLKDLHLGGDGLLDEVAAPGLLDGADATLLASVTGALSSAGDPAVAAHYELRVHHDGGPEWVTADAVVTRHSGTVARAVFVFAPTDAGPQLLVFGPEDPS